MLYVYAPNEGRIVDWTQDFDQFAVHDGLTVGVKTVTLRPGESFETTVHVLASPAANENEMILKTSLRYMKNCKEYIKKVHRY